MNRGEQKAMRTIVHGEAILDLLRKDVCGGRNDFTASERMDMLDALAWAVAKLMPISASDEFSVFAARAESFHSLKITKAAQDD